MVEMVIRTSADGAAPPELDQRTAVPAPFRRAFGA
jgi:hypothetical protein